MSTPPEESSIQHASDLPISMGSMIAIGVGNTRTRVGMLRDGECVKAQSLSSDDPGAIVEIIGSLWAEFGDPDSTPTIVASSVNHPGCDTIERELQQQRQWTLYRFGRDLQIPIRHTLTESGEQTVGQDRLLCAIGAYRVVNQACIVVDMGTAITVDFVDGEGVFHGGAIMPGVSMMLASMHNETSHLPELKYTRLDPESHEPGKQTDDAMQLGVTACVRGAIRYLAERYAEFYDGYPQIIATGGDMGVLEGDELVEAFVPDLQLHGIRAACSMLLDAEDDDGPEA